MIFPKEYEESFTGRELSFDYPSISMPSCNANLSVLRRKRAKDVSELVNQLLRRDVDLLEELT